MTPGRRVLTAVAVMVVAVAAPGVVAARRVSPVVRACGDDRHRRRRDRHGNVRGDRLGAGAAQLVGSIVMVSVGLVLAGCEEMPKGGAEPTSDRCDAARDWYIDKPIVDINPGGQMNLPKVPDPDNPGETSTDRSALEAVVDEYRGQTFTLETFEALQKALFATGLYEEDGREWGIESVAHPAVGRRYADPTRGGCAGVELVMYGREYLPQKVWERPLRLTE